MDARRSGGEGAISPAFHRVSVAQQCFAILFVSSCACTSTEHASQRTTTKLWLAREEAARARLTCVGTNGLPVHLALTPGEAHDNRLCSVLQPDITSCGQLAGVCQTRIQSEFGCARISPRHNLTSPLVETHSFVKPTTGQFTRFLVVL